MSQHYTTTCRYQTRAERAEYIWRKYGPILQQQRILDVGADECHLKALLDQGGSYWGIGLGGCPDQDVDLDSGPLPFGDGAFDVVVCCDVLEHLEHIHFVFDELCRVSRRHVLVSLPNCAGHFWRVLTRFGMETEDGPMRHYGLPPEPPRDRHRWFFDALEAEQFVRYRASRNGMRIVQLDFTDVSTRPTRKRRLLVSLAMRVLLRGRVPQERLDRGTMWILLERERRDDGSWN
jgi:SAM-dependent methyltransferase